MDDLINNNNSLPSAMSSKSVRRKEKKKKAKQRETEARGYLKAKSAGAGNSSGAGDAPLPLQAAPSPAPENPLSPGIFGLRQSPYLLRKRPRSKSLSEGTVMFNSSHLCSYYPFHTHLMYDFDDILVPNVLSLANLSSVATAALVPLITKLDVGQGGEFRNFMFDKIVTNTSADFAADKVIKVEILSEEEQPSPSPPAFVESSDLPGTSVSLGAFAPADSDDPDKSDKQSSSKKEEKASEEEGAAIASRKRTPFYLLPQFTKLRQQVAPFPRGTKPVLADGSKKHRWFPKQPDDLQNYLRLAQVFHWRFRAGQPAFNIFRFLGVYHPWSPLRVHETPLPCFKTDRVNPTFLSANAAFTPPQIELYCPLQVLVMFLHAAEVKGPDHKRFEQSKFVRFLPENLPLFRTRMQNFWDAFFPKLVPSRQSVTAFAAKSIMQYVFYSLYLQNKNWFRNCEGLDGNITEQVESAQEMFHSTLNVSSRSAVHGALPQDPLFHDGSAVWGTGETDWESPIELISASPLQYLNDDGTIDNIAWANAIRLAQLRTPGLQLLPEIDLADLGENFFSVILKELASWIQTHTTIDFELHTKKAVIPPLCVYVGDERVAIWGSIYTIVGNMTGREMENPVWFLLELINGGYDDALASHKFAVVSLGTSDVVGHRASPPPNTGSLQPFAHYKAYFDALAQILVAATRYMWRLGSEYVVFLPVLPYPIDCPNNRKIQDLINLFNETLKDQLEKLMAEAPSANVHNYVTFASEVEQKFRRLTFKELQSTAKLDQNGQIIWHRLNANGEQLFADSLQETMKRSYRERYKKILRPHHTTTNIKGTITQRQLQSALAQVRAGKVPGSSAMAVVLQAIPPLPHRQALVPFHLSPGMVLHLAMGLHLLCQFMPQCQRALVL